jgi:hypothetical protein
MPRYLVIYTVDSLDEPMGSLILEAPDTARAVEAAQEHLADADTLWVVEAAEVAAWQAALADPSVRPDLRA